MYKVFFNDRKVYLTDQEVSPPEEDGDLLYRFENKQDLCTVIGRFIGQEDVRNLYVIHTELGVLKKAFRECFRRIKAGGGLVFNLRGEFLAIRRKGKWDLPKGKLEKGEDYDTAALREVEEETGLENLKIVQPIITTWHTYRLGQRWILKKIRWYEMRYEGSAEPQLQSGEGITGYRWVQPGMADFMLEDTYGSISDVLNVRGLCILDLSSGAHDAE